MENNKIANSELLYDLGLGLYDLYHQSHAYLNFVMSNGFNNPEKETPYIEDVEASIKVCLGMLEKRKGMM